MLASKDFGFISIEVIQYSSVETGREKSCNNLTLYLYC